MEELTLMLLLPFVMLIFWLFMELATLIKYIEVLYPYIMILITAYKIYMTKQYFKHKNNV